MPTQGKSWRTDKRKTAERGYGGKWQRERAAFLDANPLCVMCQSLGIVRQATRVDHIVPHRGDMKLFWSKSNWQSLCQPHHDQTKQALERSGFVKGVDRSGRPTDPTHPWNRPPPAKNF